MDPRRRLTHLRTRWWPANGDGGVPWFAEVLGVSGLLVAQPLYEVYRDGADAFVWQRADDEIAWWALAVLLVPAVLLDLPSRLLRLVVPDVGRVVHAATVGALCGLLAARTLAHQGGVPDAGSDHVVLLAGVALGVSTVCVVAWHRSGGFRSWLRLVAIAPLVLCGTFLLGEPIRSIAFAQGTGATVALDLEDPPPILFLIFDELPLASMLGADDRIDADLLPGFARLAEQATLYRNISTVSPSSPTAVPAILSGEYPTASDVPPIASEHPENLFTLLASTYRLNVWESVAQLCPPDRCDSEGESVSVPHLLREAADTWLTGFVPDPPEEQEAYKAPQSQPRAPSVFEDFTDSIRTGGGPQLDFLHVILPHQPWYHLPSGAQHDAPFLAPGLVGSTYAWADQHLADAGRQRHLLQLVRTDVLLGRLIDAMEDAGTWDETLVIVTADHGAAFSAGEPIRGVSAENASQVMWVPLMVKQPGQRADAVDDTPGRTIDVLPTLASLLGVELPWEVDGVALDEPRPAEVEERRMLRWAFNALTPPAGEDYVTVDGAQGLRDLLALPPATAPGDDPLKPWRFGRRGDLIGLETDSLARAPASEVRATLGDGECSADRRGVDGVVPVYICGSVDSVAPMEVLVSINGYVGGWSETRATRTLGDGRRGFFALVPDDLLADEGDDIELFQIVGDASAPHGVRLAPMSLGS